MSIFTTIFEALRIMPSVVNQGNLAPVGDVVGDIMPSKDALAQRWINDNVPLPSEYTATLTTLTSDITGWSNRCGDYVHTKNPLYARENCRSICQSKIEYMYRNKLLALKAEEAGNLNKNLDNGTLFAIIAVVVILMIIIVLILKK